MSSAFSSTKEGPLCAPTCSACVTVIPPPPTDPFDLKQDGSKAHKNKRTLVTPDDVPYNGDIDYFVWSQYLNVNAYVPLRLTSQHPSSAITYQLNNQTLNIAVGGLHGCTSLVLMSTKGVWMSHFWEGPSFDSQSNFQQQVIDFLGPGDGTAEFPGISQFLGSGGRFGPDTHTAAVIITPRNRSNPLPGHLEYDFMIRQLQLEVTRLFRSNFPRGQSGSLSSVPLILDYEPDGRPEYQTITSSGKAIFQYDPDQNRCSDPTTGQLVQFAAERLWLEDRPMLGYNYPWIAWAGGMNNGIPNPDQLVRYNPPLSGPKRRELPVTSRGWEPGSLPTDSPCLSSISAVAISNGLTAGAPTLSIIAGATRVPTSASHNGYERIKSVSATIASSTTRIPDPLCVSQ